MNEITYNDINEIDFALDRGDILNKLKHHTRYYEACKDLNKILIDAAKETAPNTDIWYLGSELRAKIKSEPLSEHETAILRKLNNPNEMKEQKFWKTLYNLIAHEYIDKYVSYNEYAIFTSYFKYGYELYKKDADRIKFAL